MRSLRKLCCLTAVVLLPCLLPAQSRDHDLRFSALPKVWDEALPLGNGMVGALVWQRDSVLRISLDRADLWDLRPIAELSRPEFKFSWVVRQAQKNDYAPVQQLFDVPYDRDPAPTKIPAAALELPVPGIDQVESVQLRLTDAVADIRWKNRVRLESFVHAREPRGWFKCEGLRGDGDRLGARPADLCGESLGRIGVVLVPDELLHVVAERLADLRLGDADNRDAFDLVAGVDVGGRLLLLREGETGSQEEQGEGDARQALNHARRKSKFKASPQLLENRRRRA